MSVPTLFGDYLLQERLQANTWYDVWRARHFDSGKEVAIKRLLDTEDDDLVRRLIDGARAGVFVRHPNVVETLALGRHDENYFVATRFVPGRSLRTILEDRARETEPLLPKSLSLRLLRQACAGATAIHTATNKEGQQLHLVHRALCPGHMLLGFDGRLRIIDLGSSKSQLGSHKTVRGVIIGKLGYMSPEQIEGAPLDARSDVYALGVTLFELLTGALPTRATEPTEVVQATLKGQLTTPSLVRPDLKGPLEELILKALATKPGERFQSAAELGEAIHRLVDDQQESLDDTTVLSAFMAAAYGEARNKEEARLRAMQH